MLKLPGDRLASVRYLLLAMGVAVFIVSLIAVLVATHRRIGAIEHAVRGSERQDETADADYEPPGTLFREAVTGIDSLLKQRNEESAGRIFASVATPAGELFAAADTGLTIRSEGDMQATLLRGDRRFFRVSGNAPRGSVDIESRLDERIRVEDIEADGESAHEFLRSQTARLDAILDTEERMRAKLEQLPRLPEIAAVLESEGMSTTRIVRDDFVLRHGYTNEGGAVIVRIAADAERDEYTVDGVRIDGGDEELVTAVAEALREYDPEEAFRRAGAELEERLDRLVGDEGFEAFLSERGLSVRELSDSDSDAEIGESEPGGSIERRIKRYELFSEPDDERAGYFVADLEEGAIELVDADGRHLSTIDRIPVTHGLGAAAVDAAEEPSFLLLGVADGLTDSMIYLRPRGDGVSMVSVPRDIYYEGRKINDIYAADGASATVETIEALLGVEIDHFVAIDMDGFADIVSALGTIPVDLDEEFLDPMMTYEANGERRMLYFPPGRHDMGGSAALAFARSRQSTSDFDRAGRQQLIITGIRRRIDQLALSDAGKLYELIRLGLEYSETDIGFLDALRYYRRFRDVPDRTRRLVLSTENVLYENFVAYHEQGLRMENKDPSEWAEAGQYILRPRAEQWDGIREYVTVWLSGVDPDPDEFFDEEPVEPVPVDTLDSFLDLLDEVLFDDETSLR